MAAPFFFLIEPHTPITLGIIGAVLGAIAGVMQHLSVREASTAFTTASSLLEVRSVLKTTTWGRRFIYFLNLCKLLLLVVEFELVREPLFAVLSGCLAAYFSLMLVTLRDTFFLHRLSANSPNGA